MGLPCSSEYCFGPAIPKRLPDPAAGTSPKYREVIECLWNSSDATRYNYTEPPEFERRLRRAIGFCRLYAMSAVILPEARQSEDVARLHGRATRSRSRASRRSGARWSFSARSPPRRSG